MSAQQGNQTPATAPQRDAHQHPDVTAADHFARSKSPYSFREKAMRVVWMLVGQPLMRLTFHTWYRPRNALLRLFGARIARTARVRNSVRVEQPWNLSVGAESFVGDHVVLYCLGPITIGDRCSISQYAHLCAGTHDYTRPDMPLLKLPIVLEDEVWVAADAFVGPGVTVGEGAVVGARTSVYSSLEGWTVYGGNPARALKARELKGEPGPSGAPDA